LNNAELDAAANLFKNRLFTEVQTKLSYVEEKYKMMDNLFYNVSDMYFDNL